MMLEAYKLHPLCEILPPMSEEEYRELVEDIRARGQIEPILLFEGMILDGRHRQKACQEVGVGHINYKMFDGDYAAAVARVMSANLRRRHLTPSQRAMFAAELEKALEAERAKNAPAEPTSSGVVEPTTEPNEPESKPRGRKRSRVAEAAGVSEGTAQAALEVVDKADDATKAAVKSGETTVKEAARKVREKPAEEKKPLKCSMGVLIDADRTPAAELYTERHAKATALHRQLVEVTSDLLESPLGPLFGPASEYETTKTGDRERKRDKTLKHFGEVLHLTRGITTCPKCRGAGCKDCKNLGLLGGENVDNFPEAQLAEVRARAERGEALVPLKKVARTAWETKNGPLPAAETTPDSGEAF